MVESSYVTRELKLVAKTLTVSESEYQVPSLAYWHIYYDVHSNKERLFHMVGMVMSTATSCIIRRRASVGKQLVW